MYNFDDFDFLANQFFSTFFVTMGIIVLCISLVIYIFNSIGLYTIAKRRGISAPYTAWIPIASTFLFGKIAEQYEAAERSKSKPYRKILLGLDIPRNILYTINLTLLIIFFSNLISSFASYGYSWGYEAAYYYDLFSIPVNILGIVYLVFYYIALYKIYLSLSPKNSTLFLVLSIIFGIDPFVLFALRNKDEGFIILNDKYHAAKEASEQALYQQQYGVQQANYSPHQQSTSSNAGQYQQPEQFYAGQYQQPGFIDNTTNYQQQNTLQQFNNYQSPSQQNISRPQDSTQQYMQYGAQTHYQPQRPEYREQQPERPTYSENANQDPSASNSNEKRIDEHNGNL